MKKITNYFKALMLLSALLWGGVIKSQTCSASFVYNQGANGVVNFTSTSVLTNSFTTFNWVFGNNTSSVGLNIFNPVTTFTANGSYVAMLTITSPGCNSTFTTLITVNTVTNNGCNLNANFSYSQGANGLVNFFNTSTGTVVGTTYFWNFGDNTTGNTASPAHTYSANGTYIATLTANNNFTVPCISTKTLAVIVNSYCNLIASFTYTQGANGLVNFSSTSVGTNSALTGYTWTANAFTFASGLNVTQPSYNFTANGTYFVILNIRNSNNLLCSDTSGVQITVTSVTGTPCNINANFNYSQGANGLVNFNNTSTGTVPGTTYFWNFGDNTTGNTASPAHTYSANGTYIATLTANNNFTVPCISSKTATVIVNSYCNLVASFGFTLGANGLVNFKSTSTGTTAFSQYSWNFGNGSGSGIAPNRVYANGTYTVILTVTNFSMFPACTSTVSQVITVTSNLCNINADFTASNGANGLVNFSNITSGANGPATYTWNFGDGFSSNLVNPSHTYISAGIYNVTLVAKDSSNCTSVKTKTVNISNIPCIANANFTLVPTNVPKFWIAIPSFPWNVTAASWSWGDGATTNSLYASHQYSVAGTYTICLTVTVSCGATASTCSSYFVNKSSSGQSMEMININVVEPEIVNQEVGLFDLKDEQAIYNVYPNPTNGEININIQGLEGNNASILVYNLLGETIYQANVENNNTTLEKNVNLNNATNGVYFIKVSSENKAYTKKIIINK